MVLVHGWGVTARSWDTVAPALRAAGHEVVLLDLRAAVGPTTTSPTSRSPRWAPTSRGSARSSDSHRPVVDGWSLGGAVAVDAVARLGPAAGGLVLTGGATPRYTSAPDWPHGGTVDDVEAVLGGRGRRPGHDVQGRRPGGLRGRR